MAERRMFTKKVTDDDNFMSLSSSAQALYLHLSMSADDDGFCNQVSTSMFKAHASVQDLQALLEKRYIYQFDNGVIVIKHWRMANALRKDRYTPTTFQEELAQLKLKDNGSYTWLPDGCQVVAERLPQVSIGKDSIGKDSIEKTQMISQADRERAKPHQFDDEFAYVWSLYPKKQGKQNAFKSYVKARKAGTSQQEIIDGINAYLNYINVERVEERFIKQGSTWFNQNCWKDDYTVHREPTTKDLAGQFDYSDW